MDDTCGRGSRRRKSKRGKQQPEEPLVTKHAPRTTAILRGNTSPLSDEDDFAWKTSSAVPYRASLDNSSSDDSFEGEEISYRRQNYEVVEQNCLKPSVAKALLMQLDNVQTGSKTKTSKTRRSQRSRRNVRSPPHCLSDPEERLQAKPECHCSACCSCSPSRRLRGDCPVLHRKCLSTSSLDAGIDQFGKGQLICDKAYHDTTAFIDTKQSSTLPKMNKTIAHQSNKPSVLPKNNILSNYLGPLCCTLCQSYDNHVKVTPKQHMSCKHSKDNWFTLDKTVDNEVSKLGKKMSLSDSDASCYTEESEISHDEPDKTHVADNSINYKKTTPSNFKDKADDIENWFCRFTNEQKNVMLLRLLNHCDVPQTHLICEQLGASPHPGCPGNCQDRIQWLPHDLVLLIFSFLDPVSLSRASQVNRAWRTLAEEPCLWRRFCAQPRWRMAPRAMAHKQFIPHLNPTRNSLHWKRIFAERYRLHNNWIKGRCTVRTFEGHTQGVSCIQFDDTRIVSGSSDKTIKVWNIRTNSPWSVQTLVGHSNTVRCLHLEDNRLVSGSSDTTIKVWDLSTQHTWSSIACKVTMTGHLDTVRCLQVDDEKVISGSYDQTLKIWDIRTGHCRKSLRGHTAAVLCVRFDSSKIVSGSCDKTIKVWTFAGECVRTLTGHQDAVTCLQFDERRIVSGSLDCTLRFWDMNTSRCSNTIDWKASEGHTGVVRCLQADSWRVISASDDRTIKVWSLETGKRLVTLRNHEDGVTCVQFNDSLIVSGSYDKTVKLWDFSSV